MNAPALHGAPESARELRVPVLMPDGARCAECVERLRHAVDALEGVHGAVVDARTWTLAISYDPGQTTPHALGDAVRRLGLEIGRGYAHASYRLSGLD